MWVDWQEIDWRPDKLDLAELHDAWGASKKERKADLHLYCWLQFGKASTKDLTYSEYQQATRVGELGVFTSDCRCGDWEIEHGHNPACLKAKGGELAGDSATMRLAHSKVLTSPALYEDQRPEDSM
jgi:hypothetical protein